MVSSILIAADVYSSRSPKPDRFIDRSNEVGIDNKVEIDKELLQEMKKKVNKERPWGPAIHSEIASLLENITLHGLGEKIHSESLEKPLTPENCILTNPPKLNKEIRKLLPEPNINRDLRIITTQ